MATAAGNCLQKKEKADSAGIIYNRSFDPIITKEIRLYGLREMTNLKLLKIQTQK